MRNDSVLLEELADQDLDMVNGGVDWGSVGNGARLGAAIGAAEKPVSCPNIFIPCAW
ncbi:Uncharacterised protein [Rothia dentocariosa]|jgi:hypothetical protein|uniref:Uncharacterized protein n=1 Tax=Rothia dentocariosa TaxID=2047 RepID=A0A448UY78_9MICC|nr:Uncharacterised protein [Rothia dentocariosa]